ncbi:MAG: acyl--CoA ligase [Elusimicrobia bacterium]|nr:acyl--CoA ligase [Elusimicrobiota bacterium]
MSSPSLSMVLAEAAQSRPGKPALIFHDRVLSYQELWDLVRGAQGLLQQKGLSQGERVGLLYNNGIASVAAFFGAWAAGLSVVPLNPGLKAAELGELLRHCGARAILTDVEGVEFAHCQRVILTEKEEEGSQSGSAVAEPDYLKPDHEAMVLYTSGTTGRPKGVVHAHSGLLANARGAAASLSLSEKDVTALFLPLHFSYGLSQMLTTFLAQGTVVLLDGFFHPAFLVKALRERSATGFGGVPSHHRLLIERYRGKPLDLPSLRYVMNAGGAITKEELTELSALFPKAEIVNAYGCTEIGPRATCLPFKHFARKAGSIGLPIPCVSLRVLDEKGEEVPPGVQGEIVLGGPSLMKGYLDEKGLTVVPPGPGGFRTGDLAVRDEEGFLYHQGRKDDLFKSGGEKINARLIEEVLLGHEGVIEVLVVGVPDARLGMVPKAVVVGRQGAPLSPEALIAYAHERLPLSHVPRRVELVQSIQKTATGKIQKFRYQSEP